jgi:DNA (cytosine-5)-methyltransferase 1
MLKLGSLFCGAGGFDLGFHQAGHRILWAFDNDRDCIETYNANLPPVAKVADVTDIDFTNLEPVDVIIGGFPCQGFSVANKFRKADDDRNKLYHQFVRAVSEKRPKYFLAENVRGILSLERGEAIKKIASDFKEQGYDVEYRLFNAADFQVPQNRYRVFIWGIRSDLKTLRKWPEETSQECRIPVGRALAEIPEPDSEHTLLNHIGSKYKITNRNFTGCRTTDPDKPCPTIIARGNGKGGVNAIQHPDNHRRMTVREQAVIQTFPIDFEFHGSMSSCYRQIGNAVPVALAAAFGDAFKRSVRATG